MRLNKSCKLLYFILAEEPPRFLLAALEIFVASDGTNWSPVNPPASPGGLCCSRAFLPLGQHARIYHGF